MTSYDCELIFENSAERDRMLETLRQQALILNSAAKVLQNLYIDSKKISLVDLHRNFYKSARLQFPDSPSQFIIRAEHEARANLRSIRSLKHKTDKIPEKKKLSCRLDKRIYSWKDEGIKLTAIGGKPIFAKMQLYPKLRELFSQYNVCDPLLFVRNNQICLSITFNTPKPLVLENYAIGIDRGKRILVATSEGLLIKGSEFNRQKRKIRFLKRNLQSKGTKSSRKHLRKKRRKEANFSKNYIHLLVNRVLLTSANILVIENLSTLHKKKKNENKNSISQVPFYLFKHILKYKAERVGKRVVEVSPYNTSKNDYRGLESGIRNNRRYYTIDGKVFDADVNAAINIAIKYGKHPVSFVGPLDGSFKLNGQALIIEPIVCQSSQEVLQITPVINDCRKNPTPSYTLNKERWSIKMNLVPQ